MKVNIPVFECLRCGHKWCAKKQERPVCCGFCKNARWDVADQPTHAGDRHRKECKGPQCGGSGEAAS